MKDIRRYIGETYGDVIDGVVALFEEVDRAASLALGKNRIPPGAHRANIVLIYASMHRIPRALIPIAVIAGPVYEAAVRCRNTLYESSILRTRRLGNPVISIGNITTGGTGKTPLAIFIAKKIAEMGFIPAILSRGYGRSNPGISRIIPPGEPVRTPALTLGDEPALIRRHVPQAWVGVSKDRFSAGRSIERQTGNPVFILDDGFQHRKLRRDLDVVILDQSQLSESYRIFPRGILREPASGLRRSHAIILNGMANPDTGGAVQTLLEKLRLQERLFYCDQTIERLIPFDTWKETDSPLLNFPRPGSVFLTAALGNPERFHADVLKLGIRVCGACFFKDHYRLRPDDWTGCVKKAREASADAILITEKDAIKISEPPDFPILVSVQATRFSDEEAFMELLRRCTFVRLHRDAGWGPTSNA